MLSTTQSYAPYREPRRTPRATHERLLDRTLAPRMIDSMRPIDAVRLRLHLPPRPHSIGQLLEHLDRGLPADARIGDAHALLQRSQTAAVGRRRLLRALVDVRLDHDSDDAVVAFAELVADGLCHLGLVAVIFQRVACNAILVWLKVEDTCPRR